MEFLEKKPELGEVKNELNFKLSEGQYKALVDAFNNDKGGKEGTLLSFCRRRLKRRKALQNIKAKQS